MKTAYRSHSSPFIESSNPAGGATAFFFLYLISLLQLLISFLFIIVETLKILHRKLTVDRCIERDDGLAARQSQWLQLIMDDFQKMMVVQRVNLDKHIKTTCSIVTLYNLRNLLQLLYNLVKLLRLLQIESHISTSFVTYLFWVNDEL